MKTYEYIDPGEYGEILVTRRTEDEIIAEYWDSWCAQMMRVNRGHLISRQYCIEDWITINWASEVK